MYPNTNYLILNSLLVGIKY